MLKLHVIDGAQAGESFPLREGDNLVGRSRDVHVRLRSSDVSSLHARLSVQGGEVVVANLSQYGTRVEARKLVGSESVKLEVGQRLHVGQNSLRLQLEADGPNDTNAGGQTAPPKSQTTSVSRNPDASKTTSRTPVTDPGKTVAGTSEDAQTGWLPAAEISQDYDKLMRAKAEEADLEGTGGQVSDDKTRAQKTVFVAKEDLDRRILEERGKGKKRLLLVLGAGIPILVLLAIFCPKPVHDGKLVFDDSYDIGEANAPLGGFKILYPKNETSKVQTGADGLIASTLLGRKHDVRLVITLQESASDKWATQASETSVQDWIKSHPDLACGLPSAKFEGPQNGVWVWSVPYTRKGAERLAGETRIFFNGRHLEAISSEVPEEDQGRAEEMFKNCKYFDFPQAYEDSYWAGQDPTNHVSPAAIFKQIEVDLRRDAPLTWAAIGRQLREVLSQSVAENRSADETQALRLLVNLRQQQANWFNSQNLLLMSASRSGDTKAVAEIAHRCQAVFSDPADNRYFEVRKW